MENNKTALTHRVTATAAAYLDRMGCKPIETEVQVAPGWVTDLATYWYPTRTEAKGLRLNRWASEILGAPDFPVANGSDPLTVLVEIKTTRADFAKDGGKWNARYLPAHFCFLAYPTDVLQPNELPNGWWGLQVAKDGTVLRRVHRGSGWPQPQWHSTVVNFVAAVGIRRDHRTRYRAERDWLKAWRAKERERATQYSAGRLLDGLARWLQRKGAYSDETLRDTLRFVLSRQLPRYCDEAIAYFEALREASKTGTEGK